MRLPWSKAEKAEAKPSVKTTSPQTVGDSAQFSDVAVSSKNEGNEAVRTSAHTDAFAGHQTESNEKVIDDRNASTSASNTEEDLTIYKTGLPLALLSIGLALSTFVVALDNTIIATAIPRITTVFDSLNDVGWYGSAYLLTTTSLQPTFGKIYTYFNVKWTYITALIIFEIGSIICGAAVNSTMLIIGRAVAGIGASAIFSGGMTIVGFTVPLRKRAAYIGALGSMFGIASVVGPLMGGALTDRVSWRWCFYINLPVGAIAVTAVFFFFQNPEREESKLSFKQKIGQMDLLGALFLISAIICLLLALQVRGLYARRSLLTLIVGRQCLSMVESKSLGLFPRLRYYHHHLLCHPSQKR